MARSPRVMLALSLLLAFPARQAFSAPPGKKAPAAAVKANPVDTAPKPEFCLSASMSRPNDVIDKCTDVIKTRGLSDGSAKHIQYRLMLVRALASQGRYTEALGNIEAALQVAQNQEGAEPLIERGIIQNKLENYSSAIVDFNEAIKLGAGKQITGRAYFSMAVSFEMLGKPEAAKKQLLAGRVMAPNQYEAALREFNSFRKAMEERKRIVKKHFDNAVMLLQYKSYEKAVQSFQLAAASDTVNLSYQSWIGSVYFEVKNYDKALSYLQIPPPDERWNYYMGRCFMELGLYGEAMEAFKLALSDKPPKNRGVDVSSDTARFIGMLNGYGEEYQAGMKASKEQKFDEATEHFSKALGFIQTEELKALIASQKKLKAKAAAAERSRKLKNIGLLIVFGLFLVFFNVMRNISASRKRAAVRERDQDFLALMERNPREAKEAFLAFSETKPEEAVEVALLLRDGMAKSGDARLIKEFSTFLPQELVPEYLLSAVQALNANRDFQYSLDALGLLTLIPYTQWGEKEIAAFCAVHEVLDPVLLSPNNSASLEAWSTDVPAKAYLSLANMYLAKQDYARAVLVLEKNPKYSWEDDYWKIYLRCKADVGELRQINVADLPESMRLGVMEDMFKRGYAAEVGEYLINEPRYKWRPEYFFYAFALAAQAKGFDDAWDIYRQFKEHPSSDKAAQVYYIVAVMCEFMEHPDKAIEVYQTMATVAASCNDSAARLAALKQGKPPAPSAKEILSQVLPDNFSYKKK